MDCPLLVCVENTCLSLGILKIGPTSQQPLLPLLSCPLLSSPSPLQNEKSPLKKSTKKKEFLFSTLHSQPHIIPYTIYQIPSRNVTQNPLPPLPPCISATCHAKKSKTCSVTYLTTRVKKLHLHLQGQWTTLFRNFYLRLLF